MGSLLSYCDPGAQGSQVEVLKVKQLEVVLLRITGVRVRLVTFSMKVVFITAGASVVWLTTMPRREICWNTWLWQNCNTTIWFELNGYEWIIDFTSIWLHENMMQFVGVWCCRALNKALKLWVYAVFAQKVTHNPATNSETFLYYVEIIVHWFIFSLIRDISYIYT